MKPALITLFLLASSAIAALAWFGFRLLGQEHDVQTQRAQERLEQSANRVTQRLRTAVTQPAPGSTVLTFLTAKSSDPEAPFAAAETMEYRQGQPKLAVRAYQKLAQSPDPTIRAGALLRLARVLRATGHKAESKAALEQLATLEGVLVTGAPADLVARAALHQLTASDFLTARWHLTRPQFDFYWNLTPASPLLMFPRAQSVFLVDPATLLNNAVKGEPVLYAAVDNEGRVLAGRRTDQTRPIVRTAAETSLPFTVYLTQASSLTDTDLTHRKQFLTAGLAAMLLFLAAGTYFIARAITRETRLARMQSDFVSAVSHEFRTPLTSLRQLSEILAEGRLPNESRRQVYYEALLSETRRLQRLVETLLNFGSIEAGRRHYRFETLEVSGLVASVTADFATRPIRAQGETCLLEADPDSLAIALRNLVDNAVKYSPEGSSVEIDWAIERKNVAIRVRDQGPGIAASERTAIFRKFVRGTAATAGNVKGTGVGLAIVESIVRAHGGVVQLASTPGQGSTFTMRLPKEQKA